MASNETVADVVREMREWRGGGTVKVFMGEMADRIEAAHKREILRERHLIDEYLAVTDAKIVELRDTINMDSASMAGKDAVIAELRERIKEADEFATEMKQSTNSLVRACGHQMILRLAAKRR